MLNSINQNQNQKQNQNKSPNIESGNNEFLKNNINALFNKVTYSEMYSFDIWFTIVMIFLVAFIVIYFFIINKLNSYRAQWYKYKCNPAFLPFASIINPQKNMSAGDYTYNNFKKCMDESNRELNIKAKQSIDVTINSLKSSMSLMGNLTGRFKEYLIYFYNLIIKIFNYIKEKINAITVEFNYVFIKISNLFGIILSIFTVILYTIELLINSMKLMFIILAIGFMVGFVVPAIASVTSAWTSVITTIAIANTWSSVPLGFLVAIGFFVIAITFTILALILTAIMVLFIIIYQILAKFGEDVLKATMPPTPNP
jgi:hypothetical protein